MPAPVIEIRDLAYRYGRQEAVDGLNLTVQPGRCYGLFGRNGAGKTTTMKCLLNLLRPQRGEVRVFELDPRRHELEVKRRVAFVPDAVAFHPWMSVQNTLDYFASFRTHWNDRLQRELIERFRLKPDQNVNGLSKGQRTLLALMTAVCPEPELLILDEPTSGLDPIVRREFIETVIGAYQEGDPGNRTVFVSTHLIAEFEGLIDEFTIMDDGRSLLQMSADDARQNYRRLWARFEGEVPSTLRLEGALKRRTQGREIEVIANGNHLGLEEELRQHQPEELRTEALRLEDIFGVALTREEVQ